MKVFKLKVLVGLTKFDCPNVIWLCSQAYVLTSFLFLISYPFFPLKLLINHLFVYITRLQSARKIQALPSMWISVDCNEGHTIRSIFTHGGLFILLFFLSSIHRAKPFITTQVFVLNTLYRPQSKVGPVPEILIGVIPPMSLWLFLQMNLFWIPACTYLSGWGDNLLLLFGGCCQSYSLKDERIILKW